ncbi:conserved hypothetical protein [groundwater metagenome]|uniref:HTH dtxR-type domain-containing protein n=1 Tax=groundwater metagenome TaxID=717931 RepID=A0A098EBQ6_9ZZZZ
MTDENTKVSENEEEYLEIMERLKESGEKITTTAIASLLKISPPSVTGMLDKLAKQGYIEHEAYKEIFLTKKGEDYGKKILTSHRTWENFLTNFLGIKKDKDTIHEIACKLEHVSSPEISDALSKLISSKGAKEKDEKTEISLAGMNERNEGKISKIVSGTNFKMMLENLGVRIGKEIKVISKQPYGPITIEIDQHQIAIGRGMANKIYVEI